MHHFRIGRVFVVFVVLLVSFGVLSITVAAQENGAGKGQGQVVGANFTDMRRPAPQDSAALGGTPTGTIVENFPNTWHASTVGLTYDPISDSVWYAHEGQAANPSTIWNIDRPAPHPTLASYNLSALNAGFPVSLNDRDGAAYDPATQSFFLTDFQGDLAVRDDNIVEINRAGTILNAWELDGANNDSSDGSLVNTIIDIAIIPGTPNRYFVAAAEGSGLIREIALTRAGLWTPATWSTVGTCTVAGVGDVVGLDYDAGRNQLAVSSFSNEIIAFVNLDCTIASQFVCDGPGSAHTGVTVIPGTTPRELWVTDFTSNSTSRCVEPSINLIKTVGTDSGICAGSDSLSANGYALATYCYTVVNVTNDITFTTHTLTDTELGTILNNFPYALVPGASAFITETALITQSTVNTATWTSSNATGLTVTSTDRARVGIAPAGVCTYYASSNVPVAIGPNPGVVTSTLSVADVYNLVDVNVYLTATHTWDSDLIFTLIAPDSTAINLINQRGGNGDNFIGTVLDDHASTAIAAGQPPFTGRFIPEQPLSAIHGDPANGTYSLRIEDVAAGDGGSLSAWGVELCRAPDAEIDLSKTVGTTAGACAPTDTITVPAGTDVYYCYTVTNTGEFTLPLHDLNDNELGTLFTDFIYELGPGDSVSTVDAGLTISATINTTTVNTATWTADIDGQLVSTASDSATVNVQGPTATPTATNTPVPPTSTPTATPGTGSRVCSTVPIPIPDNLPGGATGTVNVALAGNITDLNVILTGTHSWVGDIAANISNGSTNVTFFDRPGVPASTFGCSGDNLPGVFGDDEGADGSFENSCLNATPAYTPGGHYTPNNPLSAFDGQPAAGTWTLTVSDNAGGDTGTITGWCVEFETGTGPTATPTNPPTVPDINVTPASFEETHSSPPQTTNAVMNIQNVGTGTLNWTIAEDDSRPWNSPNSVQPRDANAPVERLGVAGGATTSKVENGPIVGDGSFEAGTPNPEWEEFSSNFGTPLCDAVCGTGGGTGPRTGLWWAWFGGTTAAETGIITQTVTIPSGSAELSFWLEIPATATGTNGFLSVRMDGTEVFRAEETTTGYGTYAEVTVDVSAYADGGAHELVFFSQTDAGSAVTNFFVDDVAIEATAGGTCTAPTDIPWLTVSPTNGSTAGGGSTPVTLTFNSATLAQGTYTGTLCIESNDPDEALVTVPVTLNVGPPTAIDLSTFTAPVSGINPADLAAAGLLLLAGAVLIFRRK